jgi:hypothetical protein
MLPSYPQITPKGELCTASHRKAVYHSDGGDGEFFQFGQQGAEGVEKGGDLAG